MHYLNFRSTSETTVTYLKISATLNHAQLQISRQIYSAYNRTLKTRTQKVNIQANTMKLRISLSLSLFIFYLFFIYFLFIF